MCSFQPKPEKNEKDEAIEAYHAQRRNYYEELQKTGECKDIIRIMSSPTAYTMSSSKYRAIVDAYTCFINNNELPPADNNINRVTGGKWTDIANGGNITILPQSAQDLANFIKKAKIVFAERHCEARWTSTSVESSGNATESVVDKDAEKFLGILKNESTEKQKTASTETVSDSAAVMGAAAISETEAEAERILEKARVEAAKIVSDANEKANEIVSCAEAKKSELIEEGEDRKQLLIKEGESEKLRLLEDISEQQYREKIEKRIREHFKEEQFEERNIRSMLECEYSSIVNEKNNMLDGINDGVQALHSSLMLSLDDALTKMQDIQNEMHEQLGTWRRELYKSELQGLAMGFMNLDKIIVSLESKIATHLAFGEDDNHKEIADDLSQAVKNLKIFKGNFETSLARNSIKLLIPRVGDIFDSNYHRADNIDPMTESEDSFDGNPITAVSDAGIVRVFNSGDTTLLRAVVTVEK